MDTDKLHFEFKYLLVSGVILLLVFYFLFTKYIGQEKLRTNSQAAGNYQTDICEQYDENGYCNFNKDMGCGMVSGTSIAGVVLNDENGSVIYCGPNNDAVCCGPSEPIPTPYPTINLANNYKCGEGKTVDISVETSLGAKLQGFFHSVGRSDLRDVAVQKGWSREAADKMSDASLTSFEKFARAENVNEDTNLYSYIGSYAPLTVRNILCPGVSCMEDNPLYLWSGKECFQKNGKVYSLTRSRGVNWEVYYVTCGNAKVDDSLCGR